MGLCVKLFSFFLILLSFQQFVCSEAQRFKRLCDFASNNPRLVPILSVWRKLEVRKDWIFDVNKSKFSKIPEFSRNHSIDSETFPRDRAEVLDRKYWFPSSKFDDPVEIQVFEKLPQSDRNMWFFDVSGTAGLTLARPSWGRAVFFQMTRRAGLPRSKSNIGTAEIGPAN